MTREEKLIMEFAESETMQIKNKSKWADLDEASFSASSDKYRIKPESKYRPFKTQEECWNEMQKHQPFGWVMRIDTGNFEHIKSVCQETIEFIVTNAYLYEDAFKYYKFPDGTPFGIKED